MSNAPHRDGHLDEVKTEGIRGWAWDRRRPHAAAVVDVFIDGELFTRVAANQFRRDLLRAGIGDGAHAFVVPLPAWASDGRPHLVSLRFADSEQSLVGSPRPFQTDAPWEGAAVKDESDDSWDGLDRVLAAAESKRRLAVIAMYQPVPFTLGYQAHLGRALRDAGCAVLAVRARAAGERVVPGERPDWADGVLHRGNRGWDFGSWRAAWPSLAPVRGALDELILANDSVFGPLWPLDEPFARMAATGADVWSVTDSYEIAYHLQSYFVVLRRRALASDALQVVLGGASSIRTKDEAVLRGEVALTQLLLRAGLRAAVLCPYGEVSSAWLAELPARARGPTVRAVAASVRRGQPMNPTHFFWTTLLRTFRCPFLKRDLVLQNPMGLPDLHLLAPLVREGSGYPLELIEEARRLWPGSRAP